MFKKERYPHGGFTLIELLVVVLIIGILAAIALPQYKQVVLRSKFAKVKANVQALAAAMERYYMVNNKYTDFSRLDVEVKDTVTEKYYTNGYGDIGGDLYDSSGRYILNYYTILSSSNYDAAYGQNVKKGVYYCIAYNRPGLYEFLKKICQSETGRTEDDYAYQDGSYTWYAY